MAVDEEDAPPPEANRASSSQERGEISVEQNQNHPMHDDYNVVVLEKEKEGGKYCAHFLSAYV